LHTNSFYSYGNCVIVSNNAQVTALLGCDLCIIGDLLCILGLEATVSRPGGGRGRVLRTDKLTSVSSIFKIANYCALISSPWVNGSLARPMTHVTRPKW